MSHVLAIDQSTAGTKGLVFAPNGRLLGRADVPHRQITTPEGWVEHDPCEILDNVPKAAALALKAAGVAPEEVAVTGISNQRETAVCWDADSGQPLCNAIVWQCARGAPVAQQVAETFGAERVREVTGLPLSPYFTAAKLGWVMGRVPGAEAALQRGALRCGTVDSWLLYSLTEEKTYATDYSNAGRTQLLNLDTLEWDTALLEYFGLGGVQMPNLRHSDALFGHTTLGGLLPAPVPVHGVMGDSHAALYAHQCLEPYMVKATYGTGSSVMVNMGGERPRPGKELAACVAFAVGGKVHYALEGNINYAGAVTKWLVEDVGLIESSKEAAAIAATVDDTGGVYLVPAFSGLGAPYFDADAKAAIIGMGRGTNKAHLVRAAEECIAYQVRDIAEEINHLLPTPLSALRADGGATKDDFLMQFQADLLGIPLIISETEEQSGAGAAYCAMLGAGLSSRNSVFSSQKCRTVKPAANRARTQQLYDGWRQAVMQIVQRHKGA